MRKYIPILLSLLLLSAAAYYVVIHKQHQHSTAESLSGVAPDIGTFDRQKRCGRVPPFLVKRRIPQPVLIDLSQKHFTGLAFLYGRGFKKTLHTEAWERYGHFGTYAPDEHGDLYLAPMPFISIDANTFAFQTNIYRLSGANGDLSRFMHLDGIVPSAQNPYGITSLTYDCDDHTLWVSAIDQSNYRAQHGRIYHIDVKTRKILQTFKGFDALTLRLLHTSKGKYLLAGSARTNALYAFTLKDDELTQPAKLLTLPSSQLHIRKIKIDGPNTLLLETIPFSYTLVARTDSKDRIYYQAHWNTDKHLWDLHEIQSVPLH